MARKRVVGASLLAGLLGLTGVAACSASMAAAPSASSLPPVVIETGTSTADAEPRGAVRAPSRPAVSPRASTSVPQRPRVTTTTTSTTTTTTAPATTTSAVEADRRLSMVFTGDVLAHSPVVRRAAVNAGGAGYDFAPMFSAVAPLIGAADLAVCHLETPVAPPGEALSTAPLYGVPAEIATGLAAAGFDRCSTASNHSLDRGPTGIDVTIGALAAAGIGQSGTARKPAESRPREFVVAGVHIAHLSYAYGFNGLRLPADQPWRANLIDPVRVVADAQRARRLGAEVVVVSLHWGTEGQAAPTAWQREIAATLTASGAIDLIVGHHAHVLQPIEQVNGRWVAFGLGNVLSNMPTGDNWPAATQDSVLLQVEVVVDGRGHVTVERPVAVPTWVDRATFQIRPVLADIADPATTAARRAALEASLRRTREVLGAYVSTSA